MCYDDRIWPQETAHELRRTGIIIKVHTDKELIPASSTAERLTSDILKEKLMY